VAVKLAVVCLARTLTLIESGDNFLCDLTKVSWHISNSPRSDQRWKLRKTPVFYRDYNVEKSQFAFQID